MVLLLQYTLIFASVLMLVALGAALRNAPVLSTSVWKVSWSSAPWAALW